jgi:hypothetical protein
MSDSTLFKQIASTKLPESLYQKLEPYIDEIIKEYSENYIHVQREPDGIKTVQAICNTENEKTTAMSDVNKNTTGDQLTVDPETAEVMWDYVYTIDPYGVDTDLPEEYRQIGRAYFARSPGSDIWVWFGDVPEKVQKRLWEMHNSELAFHVGHF